MTKPFLSPCEHLHVRLTRRFVAQNWHYARQCENCGQQVGSFVKKDNASRECQGKLKDIPAFDEGAAEHFWADYHAVIEREHQEIEQERSLEREKWWDWYNDYLRSPAWRHRTAQVHKRAGGICEGCREEPSTQIHHLTYEHAGNEFLWELVAICKDCHDRIHAENVK